MAGLVPFNRKKSDLLSTGFDDFHNMLDDFFSEGWPFKRSLAADTFKVDVREEEKEYIVEAEIPGVKKEDIQVSLDDGRLQISLNKEEKTEEKEKNYIHRERRYSSMKRCIHLDNADSQGVQANLEEGVLVVKVPKKETADKSVKIEIQ